MWSAAVDVEYVGMADLKFAGTAVGVCSRLLQNA